MRWWRIHQAASCTSYALLMLPLWWARTWIGGRLGLVVFLAGMVAAVAASVLRLHLLFAASSIPDEWREQHTKSLPLLRAAESLLVVTLLGTGAVVLDADAGVSALLLAAGVVVFLSFAVIEPATTRAAFGRR